MIPMQMIVGQGIKNIPKASPTTNLVKRIQPKMPNLSQKTTTPVVRATTDRFGQEPAKNIVVANKPKNTPPTSVYGKVKQQAQTEKTLESKRVNPPKPSIL